MPSQDNSEGSSAISDSISRLLASGSTATLITLIQAQGKTVGAKILIEDDGSRTGSLGDDALDTAVAEHTNKFLASKVAIEGLLVKEVAPGLSEWSDAQVLFERIEPEARIVICGAGHVGAALASFASLLGFPTTLIDDRVEFLTRERFPGSRIAFVAAEDWSDAVRNEVGDGRGVSVAVVTRGHSEDEACLRAIMTSNADYVGLIGSKRRTNIVLDRLRVEGVEDEKISRIHAPIGLDIGAVTPEEVALAIIAEIVSVRRGGNAGSMSTRKRGGST